MSVAGNSSAQRLAYILAASLLGLLFILVIAINALPFLDGKNDLMDFGSFYASGLKLQNGENPYDTNSPYIFDITFAKVGAGGKMLNLNPPISAMIFKSIANFEPHVSMIVWQIASAVLYLISLGILIAEYRTTTKLSVVIWAFMLAGFWHTLVLGQVYILMLFFAVLGWIFLKRERYIPAGIALGLLVAIKPNFVLWLLFLLIGGYLLTFIIATITGLVISFIPILFYGQRIYTQWLEASKLRVDTLIMPGNSSLLGLTARFQSVWLGVVVSVILVLVLLVLARSKSARDMERFEFTSALGIIASLLASPISWTGYTILLLPIFFSLKKWTALTLVSAAILAIPFQIALQFFQKSFLDFVIFGWLYGWAIILLLGTLVTNNIVTRSSQVNCSISSMKL